MMAPFLALTAYAVGVLALGAFAFARDTGARWDWGAIAGATRDALVLRYLQGGNADACYCPDRRRRARLVLHARVLRVSEARSRRRSWRSSSKTCSGNCRRIRC
jgi:hypothetical protein